MSSKEKTMFLCRLALLTAAYFVLSITLTVKTPYWRSPSSPCPWWWAL
ncbi:MAG: hypothetical protein V8S34_06705 [Lawsonibacter sp.]